MNIVIDDALLFAVLTGTANNLFAKGPQASTEDEIFTTSSWYWRLSRAGAWWPGVAVEAIPGAPAF